MLIKWIGTCEKKQRFSGKSEISECSSERWLSNHFKVLSEINDDIIVRKTIKE